jgi:hypothetical protein
MKFLGVLLNSNHDALDERYSPQGEPDYPGLGRNVRDSPEPPAEDFDEEFDVMDRIGPDPDPEGD